MWEQNLFIEALCDFNLCYNHKLCEFANEYLCFNDKSLLKIEKSKNALNHQHSLSHLKSLGARKQDIFAR